jgi:hypothetical protein
MSQALPELPDDARRLIDERLDAIERVLLARNVSRLERRDIIDGVEAQIYDMLSARPETDPREAVAAVLAALDPPEAFATAGETGPAAMGPPPGKTDSDWLASFAFIRRLRQRLRRFWERQPEMRRLSPPALVAAIWAGLAVTIVILSVSLFRPSPLVMFFWSWTVFPLPIAVTVLGFLAVRRIRASAGSEYGLRLALVETFFFPVVLANVAVIAIMTEKMGLVLLATVLVIVANIGLARYAWRRFGPSFLARIDSL